VAMTSNVPPRSCVEDVTWQVRPRSASKSVNCTVVGSPGRSRLMLMSPTTKIGSMSVDTQSSTLDRSVKNADVTAPVLK